MQMREDGRPEKVCLNAGKLIVLLGSGARHTLLAVAGLVRCQDNDEINRYQGRGRVTLATNQDLLLSHLTIRENLALTATLYGDVEENRIEELLTLAGLAECADGPLAYTLPRGDLRTTALLQALLPDPDLLLIDDMASGLSLAARRHLWQLLQSMQCQHPRKVLYATSDVEAARTVADEVWLLEAGKGHYNWPASKLPHLLRAAQGYTFTFANQIAAKEFAAKLTNHREDLGVYDIRPRIAERTVEVVVDGDRSTILDLAYMSGRGLLRYATLPLTVEQLPAGWHQDGSSGHTGRQMTIGLPALPPGPVAIRRIPAVGYLARAEWYQHFRSLWKGGNLLLSQVPLLAVASLLAALMQKDPAAFPRYGELPLALVALAITGLTTEAIARWPATATMSQLMAPARPPGRERPISRLALYDMTAAGRGVLITGILLGRSLIFTAHTLPFLLLWILLLVAGGAERFLANSLLYWLALLQAGLSLALLASSVVRRPGWGRVAGWVLTLCSFLSLVLLRDTPHPAFNLWPILGFTEAFWQEADYPWQPLLLALAGSGLLWSAALWLFYRRSAVYDIVEE